jgi:hypothetical protein
MMCSDAVGIWNRFLCDEISSSCRHFVVGSVDDLSHTHVRMEVLWVCIFGSFGGAVSKGGVPHESMLMCLLEGHRCFLGGSGLASASDTVLTLPWAISKPNVNVPLY